MPLVNFSNVDFDQIKTSITDYLRANSDFTDYDFEGSNLSTIIDTLAYNTYITSYNANMVTNEVFIDSATLRENVVSLARNIGYVPQSRKAAVSDVSFTVDASATNADRAAVHKTSPNPAWGSDQPLAASAGSGRTTQYDVGYDTTSAIWSTHVTNTGATGSSGAARKTAYISDVALRVRALVMTKDAVATVKLMDMSVESEYQINRQGTLIVSKYAMGHNVLRPACAVALLQGL